MPRLGRSRPAAAYKVTSRALAATPVTGTGSITLAPLALSGSGAVGTAGTGSLTLAPLRLAATGSVGTAGTGSLALAPLALAGTGAVTTVASGSIALLPLALSGTGTVGPPPPVLPSLLLTVSPPPAPGPPPKPKARTYTYAATDLITGELLADSIPLTVQSCSRQINTSGTLTGSLAFTSSLTANQPYVEALEASRCVLWVLQDGFPVWNGIVWDWPHSTIQAPAVLPITAQTMESLFDHRMITDSLAYAKVDLFAAFADLVTYGTTKASPFISPLSPAGNRLPASVLGAWAVAGLVLPSATAGVTWSANYPYSDYKKVSDAWADMVSGGNFEYTFEPGLDASGNFATFVRLGYTQLGRAAGDSNLVFSYPGNVIDYAYPRTASQGANVVWATAPPNGSATAWQSAYPHGFDLAQLSAGYPALEDTVAWNGSTVTAQGQVNQFAGTEVALRTQQMTIPSLVIGGAGQPPLQEVILGDSAWFTAVSPLHPPRGTQPGLQVQVRIAGWTLQPPGAGQPEQLTVTTSGVLS